MDVLVQEKLLHYTCLKEVLDDRTPYDKIYIVRSLVSTREIGFLPGDHEDKAALYQIPCTLWLSICLKCLQIQILNFCMVI